MTRTPIGDRPMTAAERKAAQRQRDKQAAEAQAALLASAAERLRVLAPAAGTLGPALLTIAGELAGTPAEAQPSQIQAADVERAAADLDAEGRALLFRFAAVLQRAGRDQIGRIENRVSSLEAVFPARPSV